MAGMKSGFAHSCITRLAGWFLLAIFVLGHLPLLPLGTAAVAALDGGHRVELCSTASGVSVILRHDHAGALHRHVGLMALIAGDDSTGPHEDHRLVFGSSVNVQAEEVKGTRAATLQCGVTVAWMPVSFRELRLDRVAAKTSAPELPCGVPIDPAAMQSGGRCRHLLI